MPLNAFMRLNTLLPVQPRSPSASPPRFAQSSGKCPLFKRRELLFTKAGVTRPTSPVRNAHEGPQSLLKHALPLVALHRLHRGPVYVHASRHRSHAPKSTAPQSVVQVSSRNDTIFVVFHAMRPVLGPVIQ